jgi:hypothetical protein
LKLIESASEKIAKGAAVLPLRIKPKAHRDTLEISLKRRLRYGLEIT